VGSVKTAFRGVIAAVSEKRKLTGEEKSLASPSRTSVLTGEPCFETGTQLDFVHFGELGDE
jgi:hypothetical protein